jgi:hypothetical protein
MKPSYLCWIDANGRWITWTYLVIALGAFFLTGESRADTTVAEVRSKASEAWKRYRESAGTLQGKSQDFAPVDSSGKLERGLTRRIRQLGAGRSSHTISGSGPNKKGEKAFVRNESYAFALGRDADDAPWVVNQFYERQIDSPSDELENTQFRHVVRFACLGLEIYHRTLPELFDDPTFTIISTEDRLDGLVRLKFRYDGKVPNFPVKQGWIDLDREHFFVIRECEAQAAWGDASGTIHYFFDYDIEADGFPRITRSSLTESVRDDSGASWNNKYVTEFDLSRTIPVSKADFTLSAFGLPEPPGPSRSFLPTSLFFWTTALLLVGLLSLMTAARLNRR